MTRFSVVPIPPQQRSAHWSSFVSGIFFPMSASFSAPEKFYGTIDNWELGQISLSRFDSAPVCYDRAKQHLRGSSENDLLITFATKSSAQFIQGHNVLHCKKDGFFIQRGDLPYQFSHAENNELWVLKLPAQMLKSRIRVFDRYLSYVYDSSRGAGALFLDTARGIPRRMEQLGAVAREGLGQCLVELLCLALEDDNRALGSGMSSVRLGHLARIERYVRKNLANRAMTVEDIALANGISSRYLHELFKGSDRTIGQWIRTLRLDAALADLQDPRRGETVAEIAYRWGFGGQAQFSHGTMAAMPARLRCPARDAIDVRVGDAGKGQIAAATSEVATFSPFQRKVSPTDRRNSSSRFVHAHQVAGAKPASRARTRRAGSFARCRCGRYSPRSVCRTCGHRSTNPPDRFARLVARAADAESVARRAPAVRSPGRIAPAPAGNARRGTAERGRSSRACLPRCNSDTLPSVDA